jgi:CBS domain-containing membrane protein
LLIVALVSRLKLKVMKKRTPVSAIITADVITLNHSDNLEVAASLFKKNNIRHIPVLSGEEIIGMLSDTDLLRISFADAIDEDEDEDGIDTAVYKIFTIAQVMSKNLIGVTSNLTIKKVAEVLSKKEFHALPVVDDNKLVGIATTTDLINYLIEQF